MSQNPISAAGQPRPESRLTPTARQDPRQPGLPGIVDWNGVQGSHPGPGPQTVRPQRKDGPWSEASRVSCTRCPGGCIYARPVYLHLLQPLRSCQASSRCSPCYQANGLWSLSIRSWSGLTSILRSRTLSPRPATAGTSCGWRWSVKPGRAWLTDRGDCCQRGQGDGGHPHTRHRPSARPPGRGPESPVLTLDQERIVKMRACRDRDQARNVAGIS